MTKEKKSYWMEDEDQTGNFTLEGKDTFDPANRYVGIRLQQGVPLLDRDWNELEDIRRYEELMLRKLYIGNGTPDDGFRISAVVPAANNFVISSGRCLVDGLEVVNEPYLSDLLFSIDSADSEESEELLNKGLISNLLEEKFNDHGISFSENISINTGETEGIWNIIDTDSFQVKKEKDKLNIYPANFFILYSQQKEDGTPINPIPSLPISGRPWRNDLVYLDVWIKEVKGQKDADPKDPLMNPDDLKEETSVRHKLEWLVRVVEERTGYTPVPYHHYYNIARIKNTGTISQGNIEDLREKKSFSKLNVLENGDIKFTGDNLKTNALDRISPIYIRGTGQNNNVSRILRIGSTTVYDGGGRGLRLTILKKVNHSIESDNIYDTYGKSEDSDALENELNAMTKDQIGILTSHDAWEKNVDVDLDAAFQRVGLIKAMSTSKSPIRHPYAAIFEPGSGEQVSKAIEVLYNNSTNEPYAEIRGWLIDGSFVGSGSAQSYLVNNLGNTTSVLVNEKGDVGIGTPEPGAKLDVQGGDIKTSGALLWNNGICKLSIDQGGSIEIGNSLSKGTMPYIDFHYGIETKQDYNMRIINSGNNKLAIMGGNLGIGTNQPTKGKLQVNGNIVSAREPDEYNAGMIDWFNLSNNKRWHMPMRSRDNDKLQLYHHDGTNWSGPHLNINPNGNVGIGTPDPHAKLQVGNGLDAPVRSSDLTVNKQGHAAFTLRDSTADIEYQLFTHSPSYAKFAGHVFLGTRTNHRLVLRTNDKDRIYITETGHVGIGTTNPKRKLHISGDGGIINSVTIGANPDPTIWDFSHRYPYETIGINNSGHNLRLTSANNIIFHPGGSDPITGIDDKKQVIIDSLGNVDIKKGLTVGDKKLVPVYRFYASYSGDHFYTINKKEGEKASGYKYEGIEFYAFH